MKWFVLIAALGSDFILLAALVILFRVFPVSALFLLVLTYPAWKSTGGLSNWKLSSMKKFLRNWDLITK